MPVPEEVREAMARAASAKTDGPRVWDIHDEIYRDEYRAEIDAALSALEAAGFEVNRKGVSGSYAYSLGAEDMRERCAVWMDGSHREALENSKIWASRDPKCAERNRYAAGIYERCAKLIRALTPDPQMMTNGAPSADGLTASNPKEKPDV